MQKNPFRSADVQLVKRVDLPPLWGDWLWELKYDGWRILAFVEGGVVRLVTRRGNDYTKKFQTIADSVLKWAGQRAFVLDGEMLVNDSVYVVFDVLALDGVDLRERPLIQRKEILDELMKNLPREIMKSDYKRATGHGVSEMFATVCRGNFEGLVGKEVNSGYVGKRNGNWVKLKCSNYIREKSGVDKPR